MALVRIGKVVRAVGLKGFLGIGGTEGALAGLGSVALRRGDGEPEVRKILEARPQGRVWALKLEGVPDRTAAEALVELAAVHVVAARRLFRIGREHALELVGAAHETVVDLPVVGARAQLPGLLAPGDCVSEDVDPADQGKALASRRRNALQWRQRWAEFRAAPASAFSFVETMGLLYGPKLLADSLPSSTAPARWEDAGLPPQTAAALRPCLLQARADPAEDHLGEHGLVDLNERSPAGEEEVDLLA